MTLVLLPKAPVPLWRQIQRENFTQIEELLQFLELDSDLRSKILKKAKFSLNLPRRLASKIAPNTLDDPILRQFVPLEDELIFTPNSLADPVGDQIFRKTKKILHKYNRRALLVATGACAMHCRYCFRQNFPYETEQKGFERELQYIKEDLSLSEIILSGGDPLSLSDGILSGLLSGLSSIKHIKRIRFHTRFPIGIPERIDASFLELLKSTEKQIIFVIHCNHRAELDEDVVFALKKILCLGIPVLNQSVLLKGVNDTGPILLELSEALVNAGVIPYYLHTLDPVRGASHFATPPSLGNRLIRFIQENSSGYGVPRLAREDPGMPSKTFVTS
ncbi:MAG: KamA family radical SAM protein [Chlamydiota bacterium]